MVRSGAVRRTCSKWLPIKGKLANTRLSVLAWLHNGCVGGFRRITDGHGCLDGLRGLAGADCAQSAACIRIRLDLRGFTTHESGLEPAAVPA